MKDIILILIAFALLAGMYSWIDFDIKQCERQGGTPVGYYRLDCWDDVNKTFIK